MLIKIKNPANEINKAIFLADILKVFSFEVNLSELLQKSLYARLKTQFC